MCRKELVVDTTGGDWGWLAEGASCVPGRRGVLRIDARDHLHLAFSVYAFWGLWSFSGRSRPGLGLPLCCL